MLTFRALLFFRGQFRDTCSFLQRVLKLRTVCNGLAMLYGDLARLPNCKAQTGISVDKCEITDDLMSIQPFVHAIFIWNILSFVTQLEIIIKMLLVQL